MPTQPDKRGRFGPYGGRKALYVLGALVAIGVGVAALFSALSSRESYPRTSNLSHEVTESYPRTSNLSYEVDDFSPDSTPSWAKVSDFQLRKAREAGVPVAREVDLGGGERLRFVYVPPGTFQMGRGMSAEEVAKRYGGKPEYFKEETPHRVTLTQGFYLSVTEVTQGQWQAVMGTEPWQGRIDAGSGADSAANHLSWEDADAFCRKAGLRLPTEAEWERACRAGTTTAYSFGDDASRLGEYAWYRDNAWDAGEKYAHRVGQKKPNPWGLYDMHGSVWEWCGDRYGAYPAGPVEDPTGASSGNRRVLRGGSWFGHAMFCRSAYRNRFPPDFLLNFCFGFRVAVDF